MRKERLLTIQKNKQVVSDLEPYLGAMGHSVIIRSETLDFIHTHAEEESKNKSHLNFSTVFPASGIYKIFTQFKHQGKIITTDYAIVV